MTAPSSELSRMENTRQPLSPADARRQRLRSIAIAIALAFLAILFYVATFIQFGAQTMPVPPT